MTATAQDMIRTAEKYIGYEEKASNRDLESFHANRGSKNFQRFQPYAGAGNGAQWCQYFVDACAREACGGDMTAAQKLLYMPTGKSMSGYTPTASGYYKKAGAWHTTPEPGDIVYFYYASMGRIGHVGVVVSVDKSARTFKTVEGNTSSTEYSRNGGAVARHTYSYKSVGGTAHVAGFGRPAYRAASDNGDSGDTRADCVQQLQRFLNRHYPGVIQARLDVDGEYGPKTRAAALAVWKYMANRYAGAKLNPRNSNFGPKCKKAAGAFVVSRGYTEHPTIAVICQGLLAARSSYRYDVDGIVGAGTEKEITVYNKKRGITPADECGPDTWAALFN